MLNYSVSNEMHYWKYILTLRHRRDPILRCERLLKLRWRVRAKLIAMCSGAGFVSTIFAGQVGLFIVAVVLQPIGVWAFGAEYWQQELELAAKLMVVSALCISSAMYSVYAIYYILLRQELVRSGFFPFCCRCVYPLDQRYECGDVVCPECGAVNDASRWLINREKESGEGQDSV